MKTVELGELTDVLSGFAFKSAGFGEIGDLPVIRIRDVVRGRSKTFYTGEYDPKFIIQNGETLIGMDGEFNCARWKGDVALLNQRVCRIKPNSPRLDPDYLYRFLPRALKAIERDTPFVTVKHLSAKKIRAIQIPLPPIEEQRRIAAVLDAADDLRSKRRQALSILDSLTQATFIEMFGDPRENPNGYPVERLGAIASKFSDGPFGSNLKSAHYVESGIRVIRLQNIGVGAFIDTDKAYVSDEHFEQIKKHECAPGDVLVGTLGDPNLRACLLPDSVPIAINKADCVQVRPNPAKADNHWLVALLNCPETEEMARSMVRGQTRARIAMGRLRELVVPVPPVEQQAEFRRLTSKITSANDRARQSMTELDSLFVSLLQRAFAGEL